MFAKCRSVSFVFILALAASGCQGNRPANGYRQMAVMGDSRERTRAHLSTMADNAALLDMSVADLHFVPHSSELSGAGLARLNRMAPMLESYGGTVRYETFLQDDTLMQARLDQVHEYLDTIGCSMDQVAVKPMLSGGRGMDAVHASEGRARVYTKNDDGVQRSEQTIIRRDQ